MLLPFINRKEDERVEETLTDPEHGEFTIKVPPPLVQKAKPPSQRNYVVYQRDPRYPHIPYPSRMNQEKWQEKDGVQIYKFWHMFKQLHINISLADALILIPKYQKMLKSLLSNKEKLLELANTPLNENCSAVILKDWKFVLRSNCIGDVFVPIGKFLISRDFVSLVMKAILVYPLIYSKVIASDSFSTGTIVIPSPLPPFHNSLSGSTTSSSPSLPISETCDYSHKEFADELALITFLLGNDDLPFDAESNLLGIEYLLNHDPIKEMDSILEDSVDENSPNDNLVDTISEMFTNKHALDYSSPPLWDDYDDELFDLETVNDKTYDDPFDFKEKKIKESKLLIDELDLLGSSDFLPSLECGSIFYVDFSEVDALSSTNNEDKVFNPGILIHENLFEVTNYATPKKNVKKPTNASLILEDFNPPLYRIPLIGILKLSKSLKFLKARWRFFLALMEKTSVLWM
ncbi:hypothetical protein Tco_0650435, partial [Tanacetum coccineum]